MPLNKDSLIAEVEDPTSDIRERAGVDGLTFHDLRGTAVVASRSQASTCRRSRPSPGTRRRTSRLFWMRTISVVTYSSQKPWC